MLLSVLIVLLIILGVLSLLGIGSHHGPITGVDPSMNSSIPKLNVTHNTTWQQSIYIPWSTSTGTSPLVKLIESRAPFPEVQSCPKISKDHGYTPFLGNTTSPASITTPPAHLESFYGIRCFVYPDPETVFTTNIVALGDGMWTCECNVGEVPLRNKTKKFTCGMLEERCA